MIWALQKYWKPDYELVLANALASLIANDFDRAVMESCAEGIGHAYEKETPEKDQIRLRDLLYGDKKGNIGVETHFDGAHMAKVHLEGGYLRGATFNDAHLGMRSLGPQIQRIYRMSRSIWSTQPWKR